MTTSAPPRRRYAHTPGSASTGGGVSIAGELLFAPAKDAASRFILPGVGTRTRSESARYGPKAGVRGAALLAGQKPGREGLPLQAETKES